MAFVVSTRCLFEWDLIASRRVHWAVCGPYAPRSSCTDVEKQGELQPKAASKVLPKVSGESMGINRATQGEFERPGQ